MIAPPELLVVLLVFVLLFGASRIPRAARALGAAKGEFEAAIGEYRNHD